jgi:hypothetical protein
MYFHRANKIKPGQQICLEGIRKTIDILQCTICNPNVHLKITNNLIDHQEKSIDKINLLNRPPLRQYLSPIEAPLTKYTDKEANRLLKDMAKDRKLFLNLYNNKQSSAGLNSNLYFIDISIFFKSVLPVWIKLKYMPRTQFLLLNFNFNFFIKLNVFMLMTKQLRNI